MGAPRLELVPARDAEHVGGVRALAGRAHLERALRGGGRSRRPRRAGRYHVAERWVLGTGRRLLAVRLAHHRPRVGADREPGSPGSESRHARRMVMPMSKVQRISLAAILAGAVGGPVGVPAPIPREVLPMTPAPARLPVEGEFPSLSGATAWLNSPPLTPESLRGKVVLADIWTYTCINWLRTLPYVRAWAAKYKDQGLVVICVHSPEFPFEKDLENVRRSAKAMRVDYPIVVDSDHAIWRAFNNEYWPALYLIDAKGKIRYHQFGEGEYERTERVIQQLLAEAGTGGADRGLTPVDARGPEVAADWRDLKSGENYVGYERTERFASPGGAPSGGRRVYAAPAALRLNQWALVGDWTGEKGAVALNKAPGRIADRFR